jgi:hypothetical protein
MKVVTIILAGIVLSILSAFAGLTAGINLNPQSTVRFVPDWGSVGDWVSGVGALLAVVVSLYMTRRSERFQLERDSEQLMLIQEPSLAWLTLTIGCKGMRRCTVNDLRLCHGKKRTSLKHVLAEKNTGNFPCKLDPGDSFKLDWSGLEIKPIVRSVRNLDLKCLDGIYFEVVTGISVHRFDLDVWTVDLLQEAAASFEMSLIMDDELPF